jgi:hypothetical protein
MEPNERAGGGEEVGAADLGSTLSALAAEARQAASRVAESLELERRMAENPFAVLGVAAAAGLVLGGGLWPVLRVFLRAAARTVLSPSNLLSLGVAAGAFHATRSPAASAGAHTSSATH